MLSLNKKLDFNLQYYFSKKMYSKYRIMIKYKKFEDALIKKILSYGGNVFFKINLLNLISAEVSQNALKRIIEYPEVEQIFLDDYLFISNIYSSSKNHKKISVNSKYLGNGIGIGIVDSGIYPHKDLMSKQKVPLFVDLVNGYHYLYDDNGHGTCLSGILCGNGDNSFDAVKGICPNSKLFCYKAFDKLGKGFASNILFAINELINDSDKYNIKILCLPFELLSNNFYILSLFKNIFDIAVSKRIIPIVSSTSTGNNNSLIGIATLTNCITVSGLSSGGNSPKLFAESPYNYLIKTTKPNLLYMCDNIYSLNSDLTYIPEKNGIKLYPNKLKIAYKTFSGISIATAFTCGICSLLCEKEPAYNFSDILSLFKISCIHYDNIDNNIQGYGMLDVNKLLN